MSLMYVWIKSIFVIHNSYDRAKFGTLININNTWCINFSKSKVIWEKSKLKSECCGIEISGYCSFITTVYVLCSDERFLLQIIDKNNHRNFHIIDI